MIEKDDVNSAVVDFCIKIIEDPYLYFNESDLHFLLEKELVEKIHDLEKKFDINLKHCKEEKPFTTNLIHREYGGNRKTRIDLSIFSNSNVNSINHHHLTKNSNTGYLKPRFGFELGIDIKDTESHIARDINKLMRCDERGYIIHIYRDETVARNGTKTRNDKNNVINEPV